MAVSRTRRVFGAVVIAIGAIGFIFSILTTFGLTYLLTTRELFVGNACAYQRRGCHGRWINCRSLGITHPHAMLA